MLDLKGVHLKAGEQMLDWEFTFSKMKNIYRNSYPDDHCQLDSCVEIDEAPRLSIRIDIWILLSATNFKTQPHHPYIVRWQSCL